MRGKRLLGAVAAFGLPIVCLLAVYVGTRLAPLGDRTLLFYDMRQQYTAFFAWGKHALLGGEGLLFSLQKGLGGEMVGLIAYYLMSPVNFVFLLMPDRLLPEAVAIVTLIKAGLCGLSMHALLRREQSSAPEWLALGASVCYALMAYAVVYQQNLMWMDGLIWLPMIALGLHRLARGGAPWVYLISLTAAIVTNYYIGAMLCLFSVLFFVTRMLGGREHGGWRVAARFAGASLLAGALCAWLLLPLMQSLAGGKASFGGWSLAGNWTFTPPQFVARLFGGTFAVEDYQNHGLPNLCAGMLALGGVGCFFASCSIGWREKIASAALLLVLYACMAYGPLNLLWHGLNAPVWYPFRQSFVWSFVLLWLAVRGLTAVVAEGRARTLGWGLGAVIALGLWAAWSAAETLPWRALAVNVAFCLALLAGTGWAIKRPSRLLSLALVALVCAEMVVGAWQCLRLLQYEPRVVYAAHEADMRAVRQALGDDLKGARLERQTPYGFNDGMLFNYLGRTHFSSSEKQSTRLFLHEAGYQDSGMWAGHGLSGTATMDQLLGIRFVLANEGHVPMPFYMSRAKVGTIEIMESDAALPIGFVANAAVLGQDWQAVDPLVRQNDLWAAITGHPAPILSPVSLGAAALENLSLTTLPGAVDPLYVKTDASQPASITYTLIAPSADMLYLYCQKADGLCYMAELWVNGRRADELLQWWGYGTLPLGSFAPGEQVTVRIVPLDQHLSVGTPICYAEDAVLLKQLAAEVMAQPARWTRLGGTRIEGTVSVHKPDQALLLTIPWVKGWRAWVDGEPAEVERAFGALMAVRLTEGEHSIRMHFAPPGMWIGAAISLAALVIALGWAWARGRKKR